MRRQQDTKCEPQKILTAENVRDMISLINSPVKDFIEFGFSLYTVRNNTAALNAAKEASEATKAAAEATTSFVGSAKDTLNTAKDTLDTAKAYYEKAYRVLTPKNGTSNQAVQVPTTAFNASVAFTSIVAATYLTQLYIAAQPLAQLQRMAFALEGMHTEMTAQTNAMVQGWSTRGFGTFIYKFLKTEMEKCTSTDSADGGSRKSQTQHAFYILDTTTSANIEFWESMKRNPLPGASFAGIASDIHAIFHLMLQNRRTLVEILGKEEGNEIMFHLLVPAYRTMAFVDRMDIPPEIGKLEIVGHEDSGKCYVGFNFSWVPDTVSLVYVKNINASFNAAENERLRQEADKSALTGFETAAASMALMVTPLAPIAIAGFFAGFGGVVASGESAITRKRNLDRYNPPPWLGLEEGHPELENNYGWEVIIRYGARRVRVYNSSRDTWQTSEIIGYG